MKPAYDEIRITDLECFARHGVFPEETRLGQKFLVSLTMYLNTGKAGRTDALEHSVNYGEVCSFIVRYMQENTFQLIEAAAEHLARAVLLTFPLLQGVTLELGKPWAPVHLPLKNISVTITRFRHTAYVALGSNMGDRDAYLDMGIQLLQETPGCEVTAVSSRINTAPYGGVPQDDFLNACLCLQTLFSPQELLDRLHEIENEAGRKRLIRWGPRTLDLDILLYDDQVYDSQKLQIPHPEMHLRDFVLKPLAEIAPHVRHPIYKKTAAQMAADLEAK
ncbi:MAG: 2-amino-4-hydroxy-6-hydroxymethyldihydropteridine diphosphokinase [Eubacteriales bacterium]|nr:2-amino-4-hydroxy-6-hydroxymethyldihydropteridine diphosphokinase [Eubacteriales bacterium]